MDYDQTKKMVIDILKTDEGKGAIEEIFNDEKMQQKLIMDQSVVSQSIQSTLTSDEGIAFWKKTFEDPKFVETFAKSMQSEHEKMIKGLMKDPEYQGLMMDIMKDPELEKEMLELLKSKEYRGYLQTVMSETFDSPLYKTKIQDILIKAAEDVQAIKSAEKKAEEEE